MEGQLELEPICRPQAGHNKRAYPGIFQMEAPFHLRAFPAQLPCSCHQPPPSSFNVPVDVETRKSTGCSPAHDRLPRSSREYWFLASSCPMRSRSRHPHCGWGTWGPRISSILGSPKGGGHPEKAVLLHGGNYYDLPLRLSSLVVVPTRIKAACMDSGSCITTTYFPRGWG